MMKSPDMQITQYSLGRLLTTFEPITLAQMDSAALMDRLEMKYVMGVSLLYPDVKHNNFKAKQRLVARLTQGSDDELS